MKITIFLFCWLLSVSALPQDENSYRQPPNTWVLKANVLTIPVGGGSIAYERITGNGRSGEAGISFRHGRSSYLFKNPSAEQTSIAFFVKMNVYFSGSYEAPEGIHAFLYLKYAYHNIYFYTDNTINLNYKNEVNIRTSTVGGGLGYQKRFSEKFIGGIYGAAGVNPFINIQQVHVTSVPANSWNIFSPNTYIFDLFGGLTVGYNF